MKTLTQTLALLLAVALPGAANAQVRLTDVSTFGADASGSSYSQPDVWDTRPGGNYDTWLQSLPSGTFLNGPSDAAVQPNLTLAPGTNSFRVYGSPGIDNTNFGINLFFNGAVTPSISAFGPMLASVNQVHSFAADSALITPSSTATWINATSVPGAGTLAFETSNQVITLTDFYLATPSVFNLDQAGQTSLGPDGVMDYVGGFTLVVSNKTNPPDCTPPPAGLVSWWQAEGNAIDTISGSNGTLQGGVTFAPGKVGQAFALNHTDSYITLPASPSLNIGTGSGVTIECWVKPDAFSVSSWGVPIIEWDSATTDGLQLWCYQGCLFANINDTTGGSHSFQSSAGLFNTNNFQHVALTYDKSSGLAVLYLNNTNVASATFSNITPQTTYPVNIGRRTGQPYGLNATYGGLIDELSLYNRALTTNEIQAIYNAGTAGKCAPAAASCTPPAAGLVGWWPAEGNAVDLAGTNNGTISNGATFTSGKVGQGFRLDGTNGYVQIPDSAALKPTNVTAEAWVWLDPNVNAGPTTEFIIFKRNSWTFLFEGYSLLKIGVDNGNGTYSDRFQFVVTRNGNQVIINSTTVVQRGVWYHVAGTYDGNKSTLVVNGVAEASAVAGFALDYGTRPVFIGTSGEPAPYTGYLKGIIDEPSIYNRALSTNEILAIYNAGSAGKCFTPAPPVITQQPTNKNAVVGDSLTFTVTATGAPPLAYQWYFNNGPLNKATNSSLSLTNVQLSQQGNYSVIVSNFVGFTTSSNALLTVTAPVCTPPPSGLVGWWPAENNAADNINGNNGTMANGVTFTNGEVGSAFRFPGLGSITISNNPALNPTNAMTIEFWMKRQSVVGSFDPLVKKSDLSQTRGYGMEFSGNSLLFYVYNGAWRSAGGVIISLGQWYHVAGVFDRPHSNMVLYVNGVRSGTATTVTAPIIASTNSLGIGKDPGNPTTRFFNGLIDEVSIYNRALGSNEIAAIYNAGSLGKCFTPAPPVITQQPASKNAVVGDSLTFSVNATGAAPLAYQWYFNNGPLNKATNSSLVLTNVQLSQQGNYSVVVSNFVGFTTSSNALLTVITPICTTPPSGLVAWWQGENNAFDSVTTNHGILVGGATYVAGKAGSGFHLNGTNAYLQISDSLALKPTNLTVETWVKFDVDASPNANLPGQQYIVFKKNTRNGNFEGYTLMRNRISGRDCFTFSITSSGGQQLYAASTTLPQVGKWYHLAGTYDRNTGFLKIYVNGVEEGSVYAGFDLDYDTRPLFIGTTGEYWDGKFQGTVDEISIYNRALSPAEIAAIYAARGAGKCPLPPTVLDVTPTNWFVNEGATVAYTVTAAGSPVLTYQWQHGGSDINGATNATLTLSNVVYAQAGSYTVVVSNPSGLASTNVSLHVNRAPVADASATETLLISPNNTNAIAVLDGSHSSDPDGDALTYGWFHTGDVSPFATNVVAVDTLPVGTNQLTLTVSDGMASDSQEFAVEVITTSQAVERLIKLVQSGSDHTQPLVASLRAALASIDRNQPATAINQLEAFINKVHVQLEPVDPTLAAQLIADAQAIIDALNGGSPVVATKVEISNISHGHNGKSHLKVHGTAGHVYIIETSTDMVHWVPVGVAAQGADGDYQFDDSTQDAAARFYRVVSPK